MFPVRVSSRRGQGRGKWGQRGSVGSSWCPILSLALRNPPRPENLETGMHAKKHPQTCIGKKNGMSEGKYRIYLLPPINQPPSLVYIYARLYHIGTDQTSLMSLQGVRLLLSIPSEKATAA